MTRTHRRPLIGVVLLALLAALIVLLTGRPAEATIATPTCSASSLTRTGNQTQALHANNNQGTWNLTGARWLDVTPDPIVFPIESDAWTKGCLVGGVVDGNVPRTMTRDGWFQTGTYDDAEGARITMTSGDDNWAVFRNNKITDVEDGWDPNSPRDSQQRVYIDHGHAEWIRDDCIEPEGSGTSQGVMNVFVKDSLWDGCFTVFAARPTYGGGAVKNGQAPVTLQVEDSLIYSNPQPLGPDYCSSAGEASHRCKNIGSNKWLGSHGIWKWSVEAAENVVMRNTTFRLDQPGYSSCNAQVWPDGTYENVRLLWTDTIPYASAGGCSNSVPPGVTVVNANGQNPQAAIDEWNTKKASWLNGGTNTAPSTSAGPDRSITLPASASLDGTVTDDGLPTGSTVAQSWSRVSGPGTVTFGSPNAVDTTASFSAAGSYVLRLTATDGTASSSDDVTVTVASAGTPTVPAPTNPTGPSGAWTTDFVDEFNGTALDTTKWNSSWFNAGSTMNNVATSASNVSVAGGEARLQLSNSSTGALIHTCGVACNQTGRYNMAVGDVVQARVHFPGNGTDLFNWPAWWANDSDTYPAAGEHDVAEVLGAHDLTVNYHSPSGAHNHGAVAGYWGDAYHTYTLHRKATTADVYYDGVLVRSYPTDDNGGPLDLILNVGKLSTDTAGVAPVTGAAGALRVDYVKAWSPTTSTNTAPSVNAGADSTITLPGTKSLDGTVTDDGRPNGTVTQGWTKVSGPGTVTFGNANAVDTTASFSTDGTYVLRLTASDGSLTASDDIRVVVNPTAHTNTAPSVNAGSDAAVALPDTASLNGTVTDDGLPSGSTVSKTWSKVSGPSTVTFGNANAEDTTAKFSGAGTYVLRLTASDGALSASDDVTITVSDAPTGISYVGSAVAQANDDTVTQALPTAVQPGDTILFQVLENKGTRATINTPTGLTPVGPETDDGGSLGSKVFKCVVGSGCPTSSATFTTSGAAVYQMSSTAVAYRGISSVTHTAVAVENSGADVQHPVTGTTAAQGWNMVLGADRKTGSSVTKSNWTFGTTGVTRRQGGQCTTNKTAGCISQGIADTAVLKPAGAHTYTAQTSNSTGYAITRLIEIH